MARACLSGAVALGSWWEFFSIGFWFDLAGHGLVIAGSEVLLGVFFVVLILIVVIFIVGGEAGNELEAFEAFGEWDVDVFSVFGTPSSHPFIDVFGLVELADVRFDCADGFLDVFFFYGVPVRAALSEHHDPNFVDFPCVEALC